MLNIKNYYCGICKTTPDQISHHKSHIETQKHKDKKELFELKLHKLTNSQLEDKYKTINIEDIIRETETIINLSNDKENIHKKLKQNNNDIKNDIQQENNILKNKMINESNSVSNKEALKDKIHEIHNYLRNNGAGYGMNALKVFNILYGLKKIEENGLLDKVNLMRPDCEFSYLLQLANDYQGERLAEIITGNVLQSIYDSELKDLLFYEIPKNIRARVFEHLIKEIDRITIIEKTCNVLLSGKIYEYFIGRDESAISELGAYFTDRHIVDYILKKLDPSKNEDGTISSMIDMFGGSGGFTTGYINYMNDKYPGQIDWSTEINKIHHFDMNEDVIKSAGLEFFCLTGTLPNMDNLRYSNSFTDEFPGDDNKPRKYKYPLTNPPYGGDKNNKTEAQTKREKVKEYIKKELTTITDEGLRIKRQKQLKKIEAQEKQEKKENDKARVCLTSCSGRIQKFAKLNNLKGNDKESCSLMLLMDILEVGGTAIGVLKEGVFFNKTYKDLRKCLVENFNVREVISVPQDQFENTSTKTSIIIFNNTEQKTSEVEFRELSVERYSDDKFGEIFGDIVIIENKGDIKGVSDTLISSASREEILENIICSLNVKDYNKKKIVVGEGYELVKLGDITDINMGSTPSTKNHNYWDNGTIPWVAISDLDNNIVYETKKCLTEIGAETMKNRKIPVNSILLSFKLSIGKLGIAGREMYCNEAIAYLNSLNSKIPQMYLYYILEGLNLEKYGRGTIGSNGNLNKEILKTIPIPISKTQSKNQEWVDKISAPYNERNTKQSQIKEMELFVQNRIKDIGENEECDEVELGSVCEIKNGKRIVKNKTETGIYPVLGGGGYTNFYTNTFTHSGRNCKISREGLSLDSCVMLINDKFYLNSQALTIFTKDENKITNNYLWYYLLEIKQVIYNCSRGSIQKALDVEQLLKIKIKIPKNKQLIQDLELTFQQIETLQNEVKIADELYKQLIKELSEEAIPQQQQVTQQIVVETNEEIVEKPKKVKRTVKKVKLIVEE